MERLSSSSNVSIYVLMSFAGRPLSSYPHPNDFGERENTQVTQLIRGYMSNDVDMRIEQLSMMMEDMLYIDYMIATWMLTI